MDSVLFTLNCTNEIDLRKDDLIELRTNGPIRMEFETKKLLHFWCTKASTASITGEESAGDLRLVCGNILVWGRIFISLTHQHKGQNQLKCEWLRVYDYFIRCSWFHEHQWTKAITEVTEPVNLNKTVNWSCIINFNETKINT